MESNEILSIVFGSLLIAALLVVSIWLLIEGYKESKEKQLKEEEEKAKLQCRIDQLEYYVNVLWVERNGSPVILDSVVDSLFTKKRHLDKTKDKKN